METTQRTPNRLINEKSPYLLQHAHNAVDWFPWGEEAFAKAQAETKPVFLSIGYSTCHWCHVMERESFEDAEVAAVLNEYFVAVKVDREERPDVDQVYMDVCQALTGSGGWPLTLLLTPEREPFFAATYLPKRGRAGRAGLIELLQAVAAQWQTDSGRLTGIGREIAESVRSRGGRHEPETTLGPKVLEAAVATLADQFDSEYGGFGRAPKFPIPHQLIFLLYQGALTGSAGTTALAERTLSGMRHGGLFDQIGFGFSRYSTDQAWLVPHFEKMLYDNALLALAYLEAARLTGEPRWAQVAREIFTYVLRDMTDVGGAFHSAEDADSEGVEGKFYLWTPEEVGAVLGEPRAQEVCARLGITSRGNFEGRNIPNLIHRAWPLPDDGERRRWDDARESLWAAREGRIHPYKDDKVLTAWNGLMIAALARGAANLGEPSYAQAAGRSADFLWHTLRRKDGRLLARYREGEAAFPGYLDDYAFLALGLLELYEATFSPTYLGRCLDLMREMKTLFWDDEAGGFFFAGRDAERLLVHPKDYYDGALPSGNSVAALVLARLAHLTGDPALEGEAARVLGAAAAHASGYPTGHTMLLHAAQWRLNPVTRVVVSGPAGDAEVQSMLDLLRRSPLPLLVSLHHSGGEEGGELERLVPSVSGQDPKHGRPAAFLCREGACQAPVQTAAALGAMLSR